MFEVEEEHVHQIFRESTIFIRHKEKRKFLW